MPTDRHKQARIYVRVSPARRDELAALAAALDTSITDLASTALESFVASLRTAQLRLNKHEARKAAVRRACDDSLCSLEYNHAGKCNFGRPENG